MSDCQCRCHVNPGAGCDQDHDKGSSGAVGVWSCSPCDKKDACHHCGALPNQPHTWVEGDCVLPHKSHSRKLVDGAHVCYHCVGRHGDWLTEIVELYATLSAVILTGSVETAPEEYQKPRKRPASPSPLRLDAWALLHGQVNDHTIDRDGTLHAAYLGANLPDVPAVLAGWAQTLFDQEQWGTAPDTVSGAAAALRANGERFARNPEIDTFDAELRWVRRALKNAHAITERQPVGRCPSLDGWGKECGGPLWADASGRMAVDCGRCNRHFDERFLSHLGGMLDTS